MNDVLSSMLAVLSAVLIPFSSLRLIGVLSGVSPQNVKIKTISQEYVAVIKFGGYASENDIKTNSRKLENALKEASISYYGHFRFLGYNPPFQFIGRRNEIIVSVDWTNK